MREWQAWYVVILCMIAYIFSYIDRQILALMIEPIQADLSLSDTQFGLLQGLAFSLFYATMGLPIATLADRYPRPLIIAVGVAFWSAATMTCGLARNFGHLFLARLGVGAGEAALSPATYSLISDIFEKERLGRAVAVYSLGSFFGAGIAFFVGGSIIALADSLGPIYWRGDILRPWQLVFLVVGLPGLLLAIIIGLTVREPMRMRSAGSKETIVPLREVLAFLHHERAVFLPHMLGFTCMAMALYALLGWSPAYLLRTFGASAADVGFRLGFVAVLAGAGGVLTSGWFMDWLSARGRNDSPFVTGMIGATGVIISVSALPFAQSLDSGTLLLGCALFFASFPMPPSTAVMQILAPPLMRSRVSAIFLFVNSLLGLTVGSLVVGLLNDHVFRSAGSVGLSIVVVASAASAGAVLLLQCARAPYAQATQS